MNPSPQDLSQAAVCCDGELKHRIQALRAALIGLTQGMDSDCAHGAQVVEALQSLASMDQSANSLLEYAFPTAIESTIRPLDDLVFAAVGQLEVSERARLLLELTDEAVLVAVDPRLFSRRLAEILRGALGCQSGSVFVHAHPVDEDSHLSVVWTCRPKQDNHFQATIAYQLALRDMERMGALAAQPELPGPQNCLVLRLPQAQVQGGQQ